jgi:hypothetical protein
MAYQFKHCIIDVDIPEGYYAQTAFAELDNE